MHCDKHVVTAGNDGTIHRHGSRKESADDRKFRTGEAELPTDAKSEGAAEEQEGEGGPKVLEPDHLVIVGPDVFMEKADLVMIGMRVGVGLLDGCVDGSC